MRSKIPAALASVLLLGTASAGWAEPLAQSVPVSQGTGATPFDIVLLPFDGTTGTLTDVVVQLSGMYVPLLTYSGGPFPTTATLITTMFLYATNAGSSGADSFASSAGASQDVTVVEASDGSSATAGGTQQFFDQTYVFTDLAQFITGTPDHVSLLQFGFATADGAGNSALDGTTFLGNALVTYTFTPGGGGGTPTPPVVPGTVDVPEPVSLLAFGTGLLGLGWSRRRKV